MAQINIRIEDDLKKQADILFNELGLNMTTAFNIFVRQAIRQGGIPFDITIDPFYETANMKALRQSVADANLGRLTEHELIED